MIIRSLVSYRSKKVFLLFLLFILYSIYLTYTFAKLSLCSIVSNSVIVGMQQMCRDHWDLTEIQEHFSNLGISCSNFVEDMYFLA